MPLPDRDHNLIVLSDVHLGSDLVQRSRPGAPLRSSVSQRRDRDLSALLDWYRERPIDGRAWRLVIAGDLVDFVGMSVVGHADEIVTELNRDEHSHGLGGAVDHTLAKLRLVAEHHEEVFVALARFVAAGNTLVIVRGNHDVDFHWQPVQDAFRDVLIRHGAGDPHAIEFSEWFYYEAGHVFIEHGHQYDDFCSYEHVLHPVVPSDPRRSARSLSDILLRYVVRPTRGMRESGHDTATAIDYIRFGTRLGARGIFGLGQRFVIAVATLLGVWREHMSDAALWVRQEHERKMALLAEARQLSLVKLHALANLQRPPITRSVLRLLAGVMLDRVAVAAVTVVGLVWVLAASWTPALGISAALVGLGLSLVAWAWRRARGNIDASVALREGAARVASIFPAAFVIMGHTHLPEVHATSAESSYVNLGAWAEEEFDEGETARLPATRTHLVVQYVDNRSTASLLRWDAEAGPKKF